MAGVTPIKRPLWRVAFVAIAIAAGVLAVVVWGLGSPPIVQQVRVPEHVLAQARSGDLIFRQGTDLVSDVVMRAEGQGLYSHVGLLTKTSDGWHVIHAVPAERPGRHDSVVVDKLRFFVAPARARAVAIYHVKATPAQRRRVVEYAQQHLGQAFGFGAGQTYCTQFVVDAWAAAGVDFDAKPTSFQVPFLQKTYLLPSALMASSVVTRVWRHAFAPSR